MERKILAITGARSEYDLMSVVYSKLNNDPFFEFQILITGPHLSENFGLTASNVESDGYQVADRIYNLIDSSNRMGRILSIGHQITALAHVINRVKPDIVLVAGDREEAISVTMTCAFLDTPVAHFFGGDIAKDGNIDNSIRYASSKFAHLHFTTLSSHKENLIKLGEDDWRIFVVGNPALDRFIHTPLVSKVDVGKRMNVNLLPETEYFVLIQHPIITQVERQSRDMRITLEAILEVGIRCFVSYPNSDAGSHDIIKLILEFEQKYPAIFKVYKNVDRETYVNLLRHATLLLGNSSSGLLEAPSLKLPAINIGERQRGRLSGDNVLFVDNSYEEIRNAIEFARTNQSFKKRVKDCVNPYGDGSASVKIVEALKSVSLNEKLVYKNITY